MTCALFLLARARHTERLQAPESLEPLESLESLEFLESLAALGALEIAASSEENGLCAQNSKGSEGKKEEAASPPFFFSHV